MTATAHTVHAELIKTLQRWSDLGWLRRLDSALAGFVSQRDPDATEALIVASAILTHMEGRGHTCLPLSGLVANPRALLAWPAASHDELDAVWSHLPTSTAGWVQALRISRLVRQALEDGGPADPDAGQPLVLGGTQQMPLLYLRRYWMYEEQVTTTLADCTADVLSVDTKKAKSWLDRLFPVSRDAQVGVDWQKAACALALSGRLTLITGGPGTGKTYTAARLLALVLAMHPDPAQLKVALAAPTGKAAARLRQSIEKSLTELPEAVSQELKLPELTQRIGPARTVHSLLGARPDTRRFKYDSRHPLDVDLLIVDETSMVHLELMAALLQALPSHARLVMLGDQHQLASVEAGAVLGDLCQYADGRHYSQATVEYLEKACGEVIPAGTQVGSGLAQRSLTLQFSHRFGTSIGQLAQAVNDNQHKVAKALLSTPSPAVWQSDRHDPEVVIRLAVEGRDGARACYADYLQRMRERQNSARTDPQAHADWVRQVLRAFEGFRILCAVHDGPWGDREINQQVQKALAKAGWISPAGAWYPGRPVMITRNDPALGVFNGDVGVVLPSRTEGGGLRAYFLDGESLRSVSVSRLAHVETAFAMTVHKSQGSEFTHTLLALPSGTNEVLTRELVYTGITRARSNLSLVEGSADALLAAIQNPVKRSSGLRTRLA